MFTGIVETTGTVKEVILNGSNRSFWIQSTISDQLKPDQSIAHDGVCLTVEETRDGSHRVTVISETLKKTGLKSWEAGTLVNLERSLRPSDRMDGHLVRGHVDTTGTCRKRKEKKGSWEFEFEFPEKFAPFIIEKGSICVNGISLTAFNVKKKSFSTAIIPYSYEHTNISGVQRGSPVNIEFDLIGKYLLRSLSLKDR